MQRAGRRNPRRPDVSMCLSSNAFSRSTTVASSSRSTLEDCLLCGRRCSPHYVPVSGAHAATSAVALIGGVLLASCSAVASRRWLLGTSYWRSSAAIDSLPAACLPVASSSGTSPTQRSAKQIPTRAAHLPFSHCCLRERERGDYVARSSSLG
jgi:hypothetical protein